MGIAASKPLIVVLAAAALATAPAFTACSTTYGASTSAGDDAGAPVATQDGSSPITTDGEAAAPPATGFTISTNSAHFTLDPADSFPVTITVSRAASFTSDIAITVNDLPNGVTAGSLTIPASESSGQFFLTAPAGPAVTTPVDATLQIIGEGAGLSNDINVGLRLGSLLYASSTPTTAKAPASVTIPSFASQIVVKAWGAGGAGGGTCVAESSVSGTGGAGGAGGAGGFAMGTVPAVAGSVLIVEVGTGGAACADSGGLSGVFTNSTSPLLLAGGGGGGAMGTAYMGTSGYFNVGGESGYAGGGSTGQLTPATDTISGGAGSQAAGGISATTPGTSLVGGVPKLKGPGNGGAGYFGGGGGNCPGTSAGCGGGGGGSGFVIATGTDITLTEGTRAVTAATADDDYASGVGTGGASGGGGTAGGGSILGGSGRVVVRLAKP